MAIFDGRAVRSTPENGARTGCKRKKGSRTHLAVDSPVTPANEQERDQVGVLVQAVQEATEENVQLKWLEHRMVPAIFQPCVQPHTTPAGELVRVASASR